MSIFKYTVIAALSLVAILASTADAQCPATPLQRCDFYFSGYKNTIPTFRLLSGGGDKNVSPARLRFKGRDVLVEVDSSGPGKSYPRKDLKGQFYMGGYPGARLRSRTFQRIPGVNYFKNLCVVLELPSTLITLKPNQPPTNFNRGDGNNLIPEARRCVVFKTN